MLPSTGASAMAMTGVERMRAHRVVGAVPRSSRSSIQRQAPGELLTREHVNLFARRMFGSIPISMFGGFFTRVCPTGFRSLPLVSIDAFPHAMMSAHEVNAMSAIACTDVDGCSVRGQRGGIGLMSG